MDHLILIHMDIIKIMIQILMKLFLQMIFYLNQMII